MSRRDLITICKFCADNGIVLMADEVYQRNVYAEGKEFISAKKVALETPGCANLQLVSFHSTSKGLVSVMHVVCRSHSNSVQRVLHR